MQELAEWDSFYVIVGAAAGALIGLQFVVMTLLAERPPPRVAEAGAVFSTPTIVHLSMVLLLSALARVPWPSVATAAACLTIASVGGATYMLIVALRMRRQTVYQPDWEDRLFHGMLPFAAYVILVASAVVAFVRLKEAMFGTGAAALMLLFIAIHNAWDATAWHVIRRAKEDAEPR